MNTDNAFRRARLAAGLDQDVLARLSGVPQGTISRVERGSDPRLSTAMRLAASLGRPVEEVFSDHVSTLAPTPSPTSPSPTSPTSRAKKPTRSRSAKAPGPARAAPPRSKRAPKARAA